MRDVGDTRRTNQDPSDQDLRPCPEAKASHGMCPKPSRRPLRNLTHGAEGRHMRRELSLVGGTIWPSEASQPMLSTTLGAKL